MPLYDYQCKDCGQIFEVQATIKEKMDGLQLTCPKCGNHEARQLLTAGLVLRSDRETAAPACGCNSAGGGCCR